MKIVVVGSLNCDLVTRVPALPRPGETTLASAFHTFVGGKGCNQAIAAARAAGAGTSVAMIGRVGRDGFADVLLAKLDEACVDRTRVGVDATAPTGVALITVDDQGQNSIVVAPNANACLTAEALDPAAFEGARVVVLQLEIPIATAIRAASIGRAAGARVLLNPAPAPASLPDALLANVDVLVVNETEAAALAGTSVDGAGAFLSRGPSAVLLTLGGDGAVLVERDARHAIPALPVNVVDTTAAGDAFVGAAAAWLAEGASLAAAARAAVAAGSLACTALGAEPSLPRRAAILQALASPGTSGSAA